MNKVILSYNGSLDTTLCIHWLKEHNDLEVVALVVDLGYVDMGLDAELDDIAEQAILAGAVTTHFEDRSDIFCKNFILPSLFANMGTVDFDPLSTALSRPAICQALVETAHEIGAEYIAHGCKPASDDEIRFTHCLNTLAPELKIIKPLQEWNLKTPEQKIEYARNHNINFNYDYSLDERSLDGNLWGHLIFRESLEDTWTMPTPSSGSPQEPTQLIIEFKQGVPISINNKKMPLKDLINQLNVLGTAHGIGHLDIIGNKLNGLKTRKIIKVPGATILAKSHLALESLTLDRNMIDYKAINTPLYRKTVAFGHWFTQYREIMDHLFKQTQAFVTGEVRVELFNGHLSILGRRSPHALTQKNEQLKNLFRISSPFKR